MFSTAFSEYVARLAPIPSAESGRDEKLLLTLAAKTLPASDIAVTSGRVLESYARHALFLREASPFCKDVPEPVFLHYVFYPRVNSEDLVDCRPFFYEQLAPLVTGLSGTEAALAVNRWCAAQMTYASTDDRTVNPMTAYYCGAGRCGEESVFAVTALRSVGIPARQIYVPWWSHCDDNHAWVEVYTDGQWHFLGACEPEPIIDRGWFTAAATRAMLVISRTFFDYGLEESVINRQGRCLHLNQTARYADTAPITLHTQPGATVRFGVLNMADFAEIACLPANEQGLVTLEAGVGSLLAEAQKADRYGFAHICTGEGTDFTLSLSSEVPAGTWDVDFIAPTTGSKNRTVLTAREQDAKAAVLAEARCQRQARISSYFLPEYAAAPEQLQAMLRLAGGNAPVLWKFYETYGSRALALLKTLAPKDCKDVTQAVLESFLDMPQGPRMGFEVLLPWKQPILEAMDTHCAPFKADPALLWAWIQAEFPDKGAFFYDPVWLSPLAALKLGAADERGRRLLFVAACRSLGLSARLDPVSALPQFFQAGAFQAVQTQPMAELKVSAHCPYFQNWTLARWEAGWHTLNLTHGGPTYYLPKGLYRLITTNRLPNGNQWAQIRIWEHSADDAVQISLRKADPKQMLACDPIPLESCPLELRLYLEIGTEPTEHALNELLEGPRPGIPVRLVLRRREDLANTTLQTVLRELPDVTVDFADFDQLDALARAVYLEPGVWPLLLLTDGTTAYYAHCGYGVNTVPLALSLAAYL